MNAVTLCADGPWDMDLADFSLDPDPPSVKNDITEVWTLNLHRPIEDGARFHEAWHIGSMEVFNRDVDLGTVLRKFGLNPPIAPGSHTVKYTYRFGDGQQAIPPFVTLKGHREFVNADGSRLLCYDMELKFQP